MPTEAQIIALHKKYAPTEEVFQAVFGHCAIVWEIALQLIVSNRLSVDEKLVKIGCLLHDVGVYRLYNRDGSLREDAYITHGILGGQLLKKEGYLSLLRRFATCHTGVGLTRQDIIKQKLPLPPGDYVARSVEEQLVMYADKFHSKTTPPIFNSAAWYLNYIKQFGEDKHQKFQGLIEFFGEPDIKTLAKRYHQDIRT